MTVKELIKQLAKLDWRKEVRIKQMEPFHETYSTPIDVVEECDDCVRLVWYYKFEEDTEEEA